MFARFFAFLARRAHCLSCSRACATVSARVARAVRVPDGRTPGLAGIRIRNQVVGVECTRCDSPGRRRPVVFDRTTMRAGFMSINPEEFGNSFKGFMEQMAAHRKPKEAPFFARTIREHFGA